MDKRKEFYGEYVLLDSTPQDYEKAKQYLEQWKIFYLRRLGDINILSEEWIDKPGYSLGLKLCVERNCLDLSITTPGREYRNG